LVLRHPDLKLPPAQFPLRAILEVANTAHSPEDQTAATPHGRTQQLTSTRPGPEASGVAFGRLVCAAIPSRVWACDNLAHDHPTIHTGDGIR